MTTTEKELGQIIIKAVSRLSLGTRERRYKGILNIDGEILEYNWRDPNVILNTYKGKFVMIISKFENEKWNVLFRIECFPDNKNTYEKILKRTITELICFGIANAKLPTL